MLRFGDLFFKTAFTFSSLFFTRNGMEPVCVFYWHLGTTPVFLHPIFSCVLHNLRCELVVSLRRTGFTGAQLITYFDFWLCLLRMLLLTREIKQS